MLQYKADLYFYLHGYIHGLVGDQSVSLKLVEVLTRAEIPFQTFITAAKLYQKIQSRAEVENELSSQPKIDKYSKKAPPSRAKSVGKASMQLIKDPYTTFVACCIISSKFYKDIAFSNDSWGGLTCLHPYKINECERQTLDVLDYKVNSAGDFNVKSDIDAYLRVSGYEGLVESDDDKGVILKNVIKRLFCLG